MVRILSSVIILMLVFSCKEKDTLTAKDILSESYKAYNSDAFFNSTIKFNIKDLEYPLHRKGHIQDFEVVRKVDTTTYKATYSNGSTSYIVNDKELPQTSMARLFIQIKLEGISYLFSIPHVFDQNAVIPKRLEDVTIKNKEYYAVDITFTRLDEEEPENEFILYINKENFLVDYYAQDYDLAAPVKRLEFRVAHNFRTIEGITLADYFVLKSKSEDEKLSNLFKLYNDNDLEESEALKFENIEVELHNEE